MKLTLKQAREKRKLTQREVSEITGTSITALSKWENNRTYPIATELKKLLDIYQVKFEDIEF